VSALLKGGDYHPGADATQVMTMKVSKGLEFPAVALPGVGHMPAPGEDEREAARVFYVAAPRATQRLVLGMGGDGGLGQRLIFRSVELGSTAAVSAGQLHQISREIQ
jgi:superfamily I DNA/RNA helicase